MLERFVKLMFASPPVLILVANLIKLVEHELKDSGGELVDLN